MTRLFLSLLAATSLLSACGMPNNQDVTSTRDTAVASSNRSPTPENGRWQAIAPTPDSVAPGAPAVWTGSEIVLWGGMGLSDREGEAGGAAYNPEADTWEELAEAPVEVPDGHSAVWTGQEVLYWGGTDNSRNVERPATALGAAYDPADRTWRRLAASPLPARTYQEAVWTGGEMIVWGGMVRCCPIHGVIHDPAAAAYDPESDSWRELAAVPQPWSGDGGNAVSVSSGGDMFVWRNGELGHYDVGEDRWDSLGSGPPDDSSSPWAQCLSSTGPASAGTLVADKLFVWSGGCRAVEGRAFALPEGDGSPAADADHLNGFIPYLVGATDAIFAANYHFQDSALPGEGGSYWRYDTTDDAWARLPDPPSELGAGAKPIWTGRELVVLPGQVDGIPVDAGAAFRRL